MERFLHSLMKYFHIQEQAMRGGGGGGAGGGGGGAAKNFDGIPSERDGYPPVEGTYICIYNYIYL
jgi:hypothetical protein